MLGAGLQINRSRGEDRFYNCAKARKNQQRTHHHQLQRAQSDIPVGQCEDMLAPSRCTMHDNREKVSPEPVPSPTVLAMSNVERFLQAITPSVPAQYPPKTTVRGWRTCDVECQPHFVLGDLWESFKEWSVYGAGVPLVLNGSDSVIQYYVPYLSAIQIYADPSKLSLKSSRRTGEQDSDSDNLSRDSSSDGSSDCERERRSSSVHAMGPPRNGYHQVANGVTCKMQEGFSSDDSESGNSDVQLIFQYFEHEPPFCRVPLADKISDLAIHFPELKNLRSCNVTSSSWLSVAWYPIYRIPTGPTLKDLDACFLTYHTLRTPVEDVQVGNQNSNPVVKYPGDGEVPQISLPVFGLGSYKFRRSVWTCDGGADCQLVNSLSQAAGNWLRLLQVHHPDYLFFSSR